MAPRLLSVLVENREKSKGGPIKTLPWTALRMNAQPHHVVAEKKKKKSSIIKIKKNKIYGSYSLYIHKVLKQVVPGSTISVRAMAIMDSLMIDMFERIASEAARLCNKRKTKTSTAWDIQMAVRLTLSGELLKHALSEGTKAIAKYNDSKKI